MSSVDRIDGIKTWAAVTLILPGDTPLGLPAGKWHRLRSGEVNATYTRDELEWALTAGLAQFYEVGEGFVKPTHPIVERS